MRKRGSSKDHRRYGFFRLLLFFGLIFTMVLLLVISTVGKHSFSPLHKIALETLGPIQKVVSKVASPLHNFKRKYLELLSIREENERLWRELQEYRGIIQKNREALATNAQLRKLLDFKDASNLPTVTASIVGKDPSLWFRTVIIDRGSNDQLKKGMPVVTQDGIVGQILTVAPDYSKVLLAIAPSSAIDVLLQQSRIRGILKGTGELTYQLDYILKTADIKEGDQIVTAGYGGIFPTGLQVGYVSKVVKKRRGMFQEVEVTPAVDYLTLEQVLVILQATPFPGP